MTVLGSIGFVLAAVAINQQTATPTRRPQTAPTQPAGTKATPSTDRWKITQSKSPMNDDPTVVLSLDSDAPVAAWLKTVRPSLIVRCKEKALDTYITLDTAVAVERGDDRTVRVRFDSEAAEVQLWDESSSNEALFSPEPAEFLAKLKSASRLLFQFTPFNAPPVIASFTLRGLNARLKPLVAACPDSTKSEAERAADEAKRVAADRAANPKSQHLMGLTEDEVRQRLGQPKEIAGPRWTFSTISEPLFIYFVDGTVEVVSPTHFDLKTVNKRAEPPEIAPPVPLPQPPSGAVALCRSGFFVFVSTGDNTCKNDGGVRRWLKPK